MKPKSQTKININMKYEISNMKMNLEKPERKGWIVDEKMLTRWIQEEAWRHDSSAT